MPCWMEWVVGIAQIVSAVGIVVAITYAIFQYNEVKSAREATYLTPLLQEWRSPYIGDVLDDVVMKKQQGKLHYRIVKANRRELRRVSSVPSFFNGLAKLLDLKAISEETATGQFDLDAIFCWELYSDYIGEMRDENPGIYDGFERFVTKARERQDTIE